MATVIRGDDNFDTAYAKSVAIIGYVTGSSTDGGTFTGDAWRTRNINTEIDDPLNIVTITSNQFTLQAGTYLIEWAASAYKVNQHTTRLQNVTDSTTDGEGTSSYAGSTINVSTASLGASVITISSSKAFELQHYGQTTKSTNGYGLTHTISGVNNVYLLIKIHKIGA